MQTSTGHRPMVACGCAPRPKPSALDACSGTDRGRLTLRSVEVHVCSPTTASLTAGALTFFVSIAPNDAPRARFHGHEERLPSTQSKLAYKVRRTVARTHTHSLVENDVPRKTVIRLISTQRPACPRVLLLCQSQLLFDVDSSHNKDQIRRLLKHAHR